MKPPVRVRASQIPGLRLTSRLECMYVPGSDRLTTVDREQLARALAESRATDRHVAMLKAQLDTPKPRKAKRRGRK